MKDCRNHSLSLFRKRAKLLFCSALCLWLFGCAAKVKPIFFPEPPASPRLQFLTEFNDEATLRNNAILNALIGDQLGDRFSKAYGLAFHNGRLFVADSGKQNSGIAVVDFEKKSIERVSDGIDKSLNLSVDTDGTLYICDLSSRGIPGIVVYDRELHFLRRMTLELDNFRPAAVLAVGNSLYIADIRNNLIRVIDKQTGAIQQSFGAKDGLGWPSHLAMTPEGNILVTEMGAQSLRLYSPEGQVLSRIGEPGDTVGTFARPKAAAVDRDGNIYVVDVAFQNVQILNKEGKSLAFFGHIPGTMKSLVMPAGIAISYDRMDIFQQYAAPGFALEYVIAVSSQGAPPNTGSKISLYGYGKAAGYDYQLPEEPSEK